MPVKVQKEFGWEMGHRLPFHESCKNVHGHSYRLVVEVEGDPDQTGMVVDFGLISCLVKPVIDRLDHSFMVDPDDELMLDMLEKSGLKATRVPFLSTAENISAWILDQLAPDLLDRPNVNSVTVQVFETRNSMAQATRIKAAGH